VTIIEIPNATDFFFLPSPLPHRYVTCDDPDLATTKEVILAAIEAGASVIEVGVPFSDPLADGPVIQRASERALKHGITLERVLKLAAEIREHSHGCHTLLRLLAGGWGAGSPEPREPVACAENRVLSF
jgi:hypothetical protein